MRMTPRHLTRRRTATTTAALLGSALALALPVAASAAATTPTTPTSNTTTPIKHLVVIFQENVSFDHYFGTYPKATNTSGQPIDAAHHTPSVNGLANTAGLGGTGSLLTNNPNKDAGGNQVNPRRLD